MNAIIVDDEYSNRVLLVNMLKEHCTDIKIVGNADTADTAFAMISELKPDLVFLDIKMPEKDGFELLRMFDGLNFSVIFITAFDEYAINAFEFNAIDYLLKPIDYVKLIAAVKRAQLKAPNHLNKIIHFVHSLDEKTNYVKKLTFHHKDKVQVLDLDDIVYIVADRNYCLIFDVHQQQHISSKPLIEYEELLVKQFKHFIRVNKSHIINVKHLESYTKGEDFFIFMKGVKSEIEVSRRKKGDVMLSLREMK